MMDYMSSDIDSRWVFHTNEESNESNLSNLSVMDRITQCLKACMFSQRKQKQL